MARNLALTLRTGWLIGASLLALDTASAQGTDKDLVEKGKYLVPMGDCVACHTAPNGKPFAGNYALNTPIGTIMRLKRAGLTPLPHS